MILRQTRIPKKAENRSGAKIKQILLKGILIAVLFEQDILVQLFVVYGI